MFRVLDHRARTASVAEKRVPGPTPSGGEIGVVRYLDASGRECDAALAVMIEFREYRATGELISTTTATLEAGDANRGGTT
jgi:hypothetical protein